MILKYFTVSYIVKIRFLFYSIIVKNYLGYVKQLKCKPFKCNYFSPTPLRPPPKYRRMYTKSNDV